MIPRCNLKICLKMSRPNFEFSKFHMTFGPKVAIFYQFMHYKCHICVEFFWNVDFRRHEKLLLTTIFQIRKIWFSVKTRILPVFLHHNIIFKYTYHLVNAHLLYAKFGLHDFLDYSLKNCINAKIIPLTQFYYKHFVHNKKRILYRSRWFGP